MTDIPNYLSLLIEVVAIPVIIFAWQARTRRSIPGLEVSLSKGRGIVDNNDVFFLVLTFTNRTREVVYLRNVRIKITDPKKNVVELPLTPLAQRDISTCSHPLKFRKDGTTKYTEHEIILHDGQDFETVLPLSSEPGNNVLSHVRRWWHLKSQYFKVMYTGVIGDHLYRVITRY